MKKLLVLLMVVMVFCSFLASCDSLPPEMMDKLGPVLEKIGVEVPDEDVTDDTPDSDPTPDVHEHSFTLVNVKAPTCTEAGVDYYACECGETKTEAGDPARDHNFELVSSKAPTCSKKGTNEYKCTYCEETKKETITTPGDHTFKVTAQVEVSCTKNGTVTYTCTSCGVKNTETTATATGHNYVKTVLVVPTCAKSGMNKLTCSGCGDVQSEWLAPTGEHTFDESVGASRILKCTEPICGAVYIREFDGEYKKQIVYTFSDADLEKFNQTYGELENIIKVADKYDANLHGYSESGELYSKYLAMEAKYEELYEILEFVTGQYQIAQLEYYMDMDNPEKINNISYISEVRTDLVAQFYSFSKPIYDSMYREFYYYGMTEEEILAFIADSDSVGNEEYNNLVKANNEIELKYDALANPDTNPLVPDLYAQFVANNNAIAEFMGYDNYVDYAYANVYGREYDPEDVDEIVAYVKEYIVPVFQYVYNAWYGLWPSGYVSDSEREIFYSQITNSFFDSYASNVYLNDYIDLLTLESSSGKQISFSDEFDKMFENGTYFRGEYEGAYVTYLYGVNTPIAYFGPGYDNPFTVAHEFGHYMNEVYNQNAPSQSYDLLEMHSQGNEILYLQYLNGKLSGNYTFQLVESYNLLNMLSTTIIALSVDTFEQAVYTNTYTGTYADVIMEDGVISSNEYDMLFKGVLIDFGAYTDDGNDDNDLLPAEYWRYVTIHSPCYYVSYSISALSVLQLYPMAAEDYDAAVDSYLKLFTYTDELGYGENMTTTEILEYAGLYSFTDEALYASIYEYFIGSKQ